MASKLYLKIVTDLSQAQLDEIIGSDRYQQAREVINLLEGSMGGQKACTLELEDNSVAASGTVAPSGVQEDDTITINSVVLTAKDEPDAADEFKVGSTDLETATSIRDVINAKANLQQVVEAELDGDVVVIKCAFPGPLGNALTLASSDAGRLPVSGATLDDGTQGTTLRFDFNRDS